MQDNARQQVCIPKLWPYAAIFFTTKSNWMFIHLVCLHVFLDVALLCKRPATHNALEGFFSGVWAHVLGQVKVFGESLVAVLARVAPLASSSCSPFCSSCTFSCSCRPGCLDRYCCGFVGKRLQRLQGAVGFWGCKYTLDDWVVFHDQSYITVVCKNVLFLIFEHPIKFQKSHVNLNISNSYFSKTVL